VADPDLPRRAALGRDHRTLHLRRSDQRPELPRLCLPLLLPALQQGDIVVLDNLGSHKAKALRPMLKAVGTRLWYLPPYSPDLNPIEKAFSKIKHWMRLAQKRTP
jgi:transposase